MKKLIIAPLMLAALFAVAGGARASEPAPGPDAPQIGGCRWFCDSGPGFIKRSDCEAVCATVCEQVC